MKSLTRVIIYLIATTLLNTNLKSQGENNIWILSTGFGLDFDSGSPLPIYEGVVPGGNRGQMVTVSNATGGLLFYSNGENIRNRNHEIMPDSHGFMGIFASGGQSVVALPFIGNPSRYYFFTIDFFGRDLHYSIVDMTLEGGLGNVVESQKMVPLNEDIGLGIIAISGECNDIWLLTHQLKFNRFLTYHLTEMGISTVPVISQIGPDNVDNGKIVVSSNWEKIVMKIFDGMTHKLVICDFDRHTGQVSNPIELNNMPEGVNGIKGFCFSPNSQFLYLAIGRVNNDNQDNRVYQYNVSLNAAEDIRNSLLLVGNSISQILDMQLGPDSVIYTSGHFYLGSINKPNLKGSACEFVDSSLYFGPGIFYGNGFQNPVVVPDTSNALPQGFLPPDTNVCEQKIITLDATTTGVSYIWNDASTSAILEAINQGFTG